LQTFAPDNKSTFKLKRTKRTENIFGKAAKGHFNPWEYRISFPNQFYRANLKRTKTLEAAMENTK